MALQLATSTQLANEGIIDVEDLAEVDGDIIKQIATNLRRPGETVPCPTIGRANGAPAGTTVPTPPFVFGLFCGTGSVLVRPGCTLRAA